MRGTCPVPSVSKIGLHISNKLPVGLHGSNFARVCAESCVLMNQWNKDIGMVSGIIGYLCRVITPCLFLFGASSHPYIPFILKK